MTKYVLVSGSTGYVGGRLIPRLLEAGYHVKAFGRSIAKMESRPWSTHPNIRLAEGNMLDLGSLRRALQDCFAAYYLVHSMNPRHADFAEADRRAARNMATAAADAGLQQIIYLGGLGDVNDPKLSPHLKSRHETARILRSGPVPVTYLRAAMILGSGSASFEILRYLVERLPILITPKWVHTPCQPIGIRNVLHYLQGCLESDDAPGQTYDIGGPDVLTYRKLMDVYAEEAGLPKRWVFPIPLLSPRLSAYWIHLVTPIPASLARPLAEGLSVNVTCRENRIRDIMPQKLLTCRETIRLALERIQQELVETRWSDAGVLSIPEWTYCGDAQYAGGNILECGYRVHLKATVEEVWEPITHIGGVRGWYFGDVLWRLRGDLDKLLGGTGLRRGRRHPSTLYVGDALDFWRVLEVEENERLLLVAEMKLPGEALLEFRLKPLGPEKVELRQMARFLPKGLAGLVYWMTFYPFHKWIFGGMLKHIARAIGKPVTYGPGRILLRSKNVCRIPGE